MKNINIHIKENHFSRIYLLYGEEQFLKRMYKNRLKDAIVGEDTMNYAYYDGKDCNVAEIKDTSQTLPFFAERRLIVVEDSQMFKSASEAMADIVKSAADSTYFIFVESEVDKRNRLFKAVSELGYVCEMKMQTEEALISWSLRFFF